MIPVFASEIYNYITAPAHTKKSVTTGIIPSDGVRR